MTSPDFAAILHDAADTVEVSCMAHCYGGSFNVPKAVDLQLAAKVPALCATCKGDGKAAGSIHTRHGTCPDCPTIGRLLAIGSAVMTARRESPKGDGPQGILINDTYLVQFAVQTIACLLAVQP